MKSLLIVSLSLMIGLAASAQTVNGGTGSVGSALSPAQINMNDMKKITDEEQINNIYTALVYGTGAGTCEDLVENGWAKGYDVHKEIFRKMASITVFNKKIYINKKNQQPLYVMQEDDGRDFITVTTSDDLKKVKNLNYKSYSNRSVVVGDLAHPVRVNKTVLDHNYNCDFE